MAMYNICILWLFNIFVYVYIHTRVYTHILHKYIYKINSMHEKIQGQPKKNKNMSCSFNFNIYFYWKKKKKKQNVFKA